MFGGLPYILSRMTKREATIFREIVTFHPSFSEEQEAVDELIQFFYDLVRDEPTVLAKVETAFRERYGYVYDSDSGGGGE